ncbi:MULTISPECIES: DUF4180 domain-containing protein [Listeria]|uniref:DUF4180 domain-containing protein n=1 Tax=Listeria TaxID=1637 RepID=UPI000B58BFB9|nr:MULTISPECIES: DUF4180 domain-containing protein [Listeria]
MNTKIVIENGLRCAIIHHDKVIISSVETALDVIMTVQYENDCTRIALNKEAFDERFFDLRSGLAGEVLQKFVTYQTKLAIVGDFSVYRSKALQDFMRESNAGDAIFFAQNEAEALEKLCGDAI